VARQGKRLSAKGGHWRTKGGEVGPYLRRGFTKRQKESDHKKKQKGHKRGIPEGREINGALVKSSRRSAIVETTSHLRRGGYVQ